MIEEQYIVDFTSEEIESLKGQEIRRISGAGHNPVLNDSHLENISKIVGLKELDLEWAGKITDKGLKYLESVKSLRYIDLDFCFLLTDEAKRSLREAVPDLIIE